MSRYKNIKPLKKIIGRTDMLTAEKIDKWRRDLLQDLEGKMEIKDSGTRRTFETDAVRDMAEGKGRFDLLPMCVLMRLAQHYEKGAKKYEERNWEKGIPAHSYVDSAFRHLVKYVDGWVDEDHLISAIWNLCCLAWTEENKPEMLDLPFQKQLKKMTEPLGKFKACAVTECYYNDDALCVCDNEGADPSLWKGCKWYSED